MHDPFIVALVFAGGAAGSVARWLLGIAIGERHHGTLPLGTLAINVTGAFLMGFLSTLFYVDWRDRYGSDLTALVLTGVLGGYTTFSSYQLEVADLWGKGARLWAVSYWIGSVVLGLAAAALGAVAALGLGHG